MPRRSRPSKRDCSSTVSLVSERPDFWLLLGYGMIPVAVMLVAAGIVMSLLHPIETLASTAPVVAAFALGFEIRKRGR